MRIGNRCTRPAPASGKPGTKILPARIAFRLPLLFLAALPMSIPAHTPAKPANPGFEQKDSTGWGWRTTARASWALSSHDPHSGKQCITFHNDSPLAPNVYGRLEQGIPVSPSTRYRLSVWVRGKDVSLGNHMTDWNAYTLPFPDGTFGWKRVAVVFQTRPGQNWLPLGVNIVSPCGELALDDVRVNAVGTTFSAPGLKGSLVVPGSVAGDNTTASLLLSIRRKASTASGAAITITTSDSQTLFSRKVRVRKGSNRFSFPWNTGTGHDRALTCLVTIHDRNGDVLTSISQGIDNPGSNLNREIDRQAQRLDRLKDLIRQCKKKGIPVDYPTVTRAMLDQFMPLAREDVRAGELQWATFAIHDFSRSLDRAILETESYLQNPASAPSVPRYHTGRRVKIAGLSFTGKRKQSDGKLTTGPEFFCGFGHFAQLSRDLDRFHDYGINIIQVEIGPSAVLTGEHSVSLDRLHDLEHLLDRAAKDDIAVNVLLSPHYFPAWAMKKWPDLARGGGGFLGYRVDAPEARAVVEKFLRIVVPRLAKKPALFSFCLSNEPVFDRSLQCPDTPSRWAKWLETRYDGIASLNHAYGTTFTAFLQVPVPGNGDSGAPWFCDYCSFNQDRFSAWHAWMAEVIHDMAPDIPVHAKPMNMMILNSGTAAWGVDPEQFARLSQISGNDCTYWAQPAGMDDPPAAEWLTQNLTYDLQRSVARQPIFNSENHITPDRSTFYVSPQVFRAALWQGAIHGQGATTIWVWERSRDKGADVYGNVMYRPGCAEETGRVCLDLNRLADPVTTLETAPARVAIVYSPASFAKSTEYLARLKQLYTALNFSGVRVGFLTERQIASGRLGDSRIIFFPGVTHLERKTVQALLHEHLAGRHMMSTGQPTRLDAAGQPLSESEKRALGETITPLNSASTDPVQLRRQVGPILDQCHAAPEWRLVDVKTDETPWGIEWLAAKKKDPSGESWLINAVNETRKTITVRLTRSDDQPPASTRDLVNGQVEGKTITLRPFEPVLLEMESGSKSAPVSPE